MQSLDTNTIAALSGKAIRPRHFVRLGARSYSTGIVSIDSFWTGIDDVSAIVVDGQTGNETVYTFKAAGSILSIGDIQYVCEQSITDRTVSIQLNYLNPDIRNVVMGYDLHEQLMEIYQGLLSLDGNVLISPAIPVFVGVIDTSKVTTSSDGGYCSIEVKGRGNTSDMTRTNTIKRTHESEVLRDPTDMFYVDVQTIKDWKLPWGMSG